MFTGIIKSQGKITKLKDNVLTIESNFENLKIGGSVSVDGICLTIAEIEKTKATFNVMDETINLTNLKEGNEVNLEPALRLGDPLDGHLVQGHIDSTGKTIEVKEEANQTAIKFAYPKEFAKYLALKGSITVNGVSLTVSNLDRETFEVSLVKHTLENTNLPKLKKGDTVNLEFDAISKYLESLLDKKEGETKYSYLVERGFI